MKIGGTYYDPSYGATFGSLATIDNTAIDGYYMWDLTNVDEPDVGLDLNGDFDQLDTIRMWAFVFRTNAPGNQLGETRYEYPFP